ncbi:hypothetical protein [Agromyces italicus]|uniref:hypothetical protein n=1 Tax=Agromyces italicus TaxID=279572 RepID=UPI0003B78FED|nr:hypothetical protein [Agromyces italicus]
MDVGELDLAPLTEPAGRAAVQRARERSREQGLARHEAVGGCVLIGLVFVACGLGALIFGALWGPLGAALPVIVGIVATSFVVVATRRRAGAGRIRRYRLQRFAERNGARYLPRVSDPERPGRIFGIGSVAVSNDVVRFDGAREIEVGNHAYSTGYRDSVRMSWGYASATLKHEAPRCTVDLRRRGAAARQTPPAPLDVALGDVDLAGLEHGGELAARFAVSSRIGRSETVRELLGRTVFVPELVERVTARGLDLEIVEDRLILTSPEQLSSDDPETWRWLLPLLVEIADAIDAALGPAD